MKNIKFIYIGVASLFINRSALAQTQIDSTKKSTKSLISNDGIKVNFSEDGSTWAKINFAGQLWAIDNHNNPGSTVNGVTDNNSYQVALRRVRLRIQAQVTNKVFIYGQIASDGISSLTVGRSVPLQLIDMTVEYKLLGKYLSLGGGLSAWAGPSRYSTSSTPSILGLDIPSYQQTTSNITDNTARMPGLYAKGKLSKFDYRIAVNIPYPTTTTTAWTNTLTVASTTVNPQFNASTFATNKIQPQVQGYFMYQFLNQESNLTPNTVGSYLGQSKVFNIGAGFRYQQNAMWQAGYSQGTNAGGTQIYTLKDTVRTAMFLWSVDLFYDTPINKEKGSAITVYAAYSNYNFGNNYIRNNNPLNPTTTTFANPVTNVGNSKTTGNFNPGLSSFNGAGNQFPMIGTGSIYYVQAGYLLPKFKDNTQLQPYGQVMYADYQALKGADIVWNLGLNYLIKGHNAKFTLDYQSRPVYNLSTSDYQVHTVNGVRRGQVVLQYQISF